MITQHTEDLVPPRMTGDPPAAGKRVSQTAAEYRETRVHHSLYLPVDWIPEWERKKIRYPVIVEYTGNRHPVSGWTGMVADDRLGYGLGGGSRWHPHDHLTGIAVGPPKGSRWFDGQQAVENHFCRV